VIESASDVESVGRKGSGVKVELEKKKVELQLRLSSVDKQFTLKRDEVVLQLSAVDAALMKIESSVELRDGLDLIAQALS